MEEIFMWEFIFYGIIAAVGVTAIAVTIYRIDWARHPEKYQKDLEELEKEEKTKANRKIAEQNAKAKMKKSRKK